MVKTNTNDKMKIVLIVFILVVVGFSYLITKGLNENNAENAEIALPCYSNIKKRLGLERMVNNAMVMEFELKRNYESSNYISRENYRKIMGSSCNKDDYEEEQSQDEYIAIKEDLQNQFHRKESK